MPIPVPLAIAVLPGIFVPVLAEIFTGGGIPIAFIVPVGPFLLWAVFTLAAAYVVRRAEQKRRRIAKEKIDRVMNGVNPYGGWTYKRHFLEEWREGRGTKAVTLPLEVRK